METAGVGLLAYQKAAVDSPARFTWACWARQTGKSFTFGLRRLMRGLSRRRNQIILSAGERQSREVMEKVRQHCAAHRVYCELRNVTFYADRSIPKLEIRLPGGMRIIGLPANPMTARGYTGDVFLDEFAMHRDDEAIWSALFPTLLRGDGELDVASTPRGRKNAFYRMRHSPSFATSTLTLEDAVTQGLSADPAAMRAAIGDELAWRQEFCCEFADEATAFLTHDLIRRCQDIRLRREVDWAALARRDAEVYAGIDVGRRTDLTVAWLWERAGEELITRGVEVMRNTPFGEQEARLDRILRHRGVRRCCIDGTGLGMQLAETLATRFGEDRIERMTFTPALKSELAGRLRVFAERGHLRIPVDEEVVNDWHSIEQMVTTGGHVRFDADRSAGGHADRFWAAALGIHAAGRSPGLPDFQTAGSAMFKREGAW
jgi:phage FluMu gp28-like protein